MKKILVTAGGTAIGWHVCKIAHDYFKNDIEVHICDINESHLVPASVYASKTHKVPISESHKYLGAVDKIINNEEIDTIIPLLPEETFLFAKDSDYIVKKGIESSIPPLSTVSKLTDKLQMYGFLKSVGIPTPQVITLDEIRKKDLKCKKYLVKPRLGFGSIGIKMITGEQILNDETGEFTDDKYIIQEYCKENDYDEVTVEVFNAEPTLEIFARRRIAVKSGVCVKTEAVENKQFYTYIHKLVKSIEMPVAFNVQFLHHRGEWKLFDCNLRLGAGTALSTAFGFQLTRAFLAYLIGKRDLNEMFNVDRKIKSVLRVYEEIVIK